MATEVDCMCIGEDSDDFMAYNARIEAVRELEFRRLQGVTFMDHAGTTLYPLSLLDSYHHDLASHIYGNPHSGNASSQLSADIIEQVRYRILNHFNTSSEEYSVIFTSGCTAALKLVAETFDFNNFKVSSQNSSNSRKFGVSINPDNEANFKKGQFYYLEDNHTSVLGMREIAIIRGANVTAVSCDDVTSFTSGLPNCDPGLNSLFAYPAQSNFSGKRYPFSWITKIKNTGLGTSGIWYVLLDAASFVTSAPLDLNKYSPDFVSISFYKMFGFPTGLGALLVRNRSANVLKKTYFGGGTVQVSLATEHFHANKTNLSDCFEDGTLPFLEIIALRHCFESLNRLTGGVENISRHTFALAQYVFNHLAACRHGNQAPVAILYCDGRFESSETQGPIVNFNLIHADGSYIGFAEVDKLAQAYGIHLRVGCFCNMGACQQALQLSTEQIKDNFKAGHVCGDDLDLIDGQPTGSVRVSFGYMSTLSDAQTLLQFVEDCFVEGRPKKMFLKQKGRTDDYSSASMEIDTTVDGNYAKSKVLESCGRQISNSICGDDVTSDAFNMQVDNGDKGKSMINYMDLSDNDKTVPAETNCSLSEKAQIDKDVIPSHAAHPLSSWMLTDIFLYPVKSCAAFQASQWSIGPHGLKYDREWMVINEAGLCVSQKREPALCKIRPFVDIENGILRLKFPGSSEVTVPLDPPEDQDTRAANICTTKVCGDRVQGLDCGDEVATWLEKTLGKAGYRLMRQSSKHQRTGKDRGQGEQQKSLSLANQAQFLLITRPSVRALRQKMMETQPATGVLDMEELITRFRANLVVDGPGEAFCEDSWCQIDFGDVRLKAHGRCDRCQMICVDQMTGQRSHEPLLTLTTLRNRKTTFGLLLRHSFKNSAVNTLATKQEALPHMEDACIIKQESKNNK